MPLSFNVDPAPGETRACLDPWRFVILRSNGDVSLCCRSPVVGNVNAAKLEEIVEGRAGNDLRRELLTGELAPHCLHCSERAVTTTAALRADVERLQAEDGEETLARLRVENRALKQVRSDLMRARSELSTRVSDLEDARPLPLRLWTRARRTAKQLARRLRGFVRR